MKRQKSFWMSVSLLAVLVLGGCASLATRDAKATLTAQQQQEEQKRQHDYHMSQQSDYGS